MLVLILYGIVVFIAINIIIVIRSLLLLFLCLLWVLVLFPSLLSDGKGRFRPQQIHQDLFREALIGRVANHGANLRSPARKELQALFEARIIDRVGAPIDKASRGSSSSSSNSSAVFIVVLVVRWFLAANRSSQGAPKAVAVFQDNLHSSKEWMVVFWTGVCSQSPGRFGVSNERISLYYF